VAVDLHMHSTASDGADQPNQLPQRVAEAGLEAFALTDHDTVAGLAAAGAGADALGLVFVPGIELSADPGPEGGTMHILGYLFDSTAPELVSLIKNVQEARRERNPQIVERLQALGVDMTIEEVRQRADGGVVGRPHIAAVLIEKGYAKTMQDAFMRYLGEQGAAYVVKHRATAKMAIEAIHAAGGLAVLAHPVQLRREGQEFHQTVAQLVDDGLDGLEIHHPDHEPRDRQRLEQLAQRFDLLMTGGSDYHGPDGPRTLGCCSVDMDALDAMRRVVVDRS
jgi:predicted metal-dependent phosphoesterase TrpH